MITPLKEGEPLPKVIKTRGVGFFPSQEFKHTAHTTGQAAQILWHFAENWLTSFPGYRTSSGKIGLWVCTTYSRSRKNLSMGLIVSAG